MNQGITDEQALHYLQGKIAHHTAQLEKWKKALEAVGGIVGQSSGKGEKKKPVLKKKAGAKIPKFAGRVLSLLENGPMTGRQIFDLFRKKKWTKTKKYEHFSVQLSTVSRKGAHIKKYSFKGASRENKYWYAPSDHFNAKGNLLPKYVEIISKKING